MELTDNIKQALMEKKPGLSEKTIQRYINDTQRIYKQVFGKDLNKEKNFKWIRSIDQIEKYFDENKRSISTRNTIYSSIIEVLRALDHPDTKGLKDLIEQRQKYGDEYNSIEDGLKSKKQEDSFIDAKLIDDKIDQYEKEINLFIFKKKGKQKRIWLSWILRDGLSQKTNIKHQKNMVK